MNDTLIQDGLDLMLFGMGTVLVFLALLALATILMSTVVARWFSEPDGLQDAGPESRPSRRPAPPEVDDKVLTVIKAAIEQHRARRR